MKTVYLVRHGESEGNARLIHQGPTSPLTERGRQQATFIAHRCAKLPIDVILSSTTKRAEETADIIQKHIHAPIEYSPLFVERRYPKERTGLDRNDPVGIHISKILKENFIRSGFHFSNEENFEDLQKRALEALEFLNNRSEKNILVVTHSIFLKILIAHVLFDQALTATMCLRFMSCLLSENTGLTVLQSSDEGVSKSWRLLIWNDHSHLG